MWPGLAVAAAVVAPPGSTLKGGRGEGGGGGCFGVGGGGAGRGPNGGREGGNYGAGKNASATQFANGPAHGHSQVISSICLESVDSGWADSFF